MCFPQKVGGEEGLTGSSVGQTYRADQDGPYKGADARECSINLSTGYAQGVDSMEANLTLAPQEPLRGP